MTIKEIISEKEDVLRGKAATMKEIQSAEKELGLKFANDYKEYLLTFGDITYEGHELTGISFSKRINVVDVTKKIKRNLKHIPHNYYVLEDANYDGIVFWQNEEGIVFRSIGKSEPIKAYDSLMDFLLM